MLLSEQSPSHRGSLGFLPWAGWRHLCSFWCAQTPGPWVMLLAGGCGGDGTSLPSTPHLVWRAKAPGPWLSPCKRLILTQTLGMLESCWAQAKHTLLTGTSVLCPPSSSALPLGSANPGLGSRGLSPPTQQGSDFLPASGPETKTVLQSPFGCISQRLPGASQGGGGTDGFQTTLVWAVPQVSASRHVHAP